MSYSNIGVIYESQEDLEMALDYYQNLDADDLKLSQGAPAMAMKQVAQVLDRQGDKKSAITLLDRALEALEELVNEYPKDDLVRYRLGMVQVYLLEVHMMSGN